MQTDAEHQQNDADFSELRCDSNIAHACRRVWPQQNAGYEIADEGRKIDFRRAKSKDERSGEGTGDGDEKSGIVHWRRVPALNTDERFIADMADMVVRTLNMYMDYSALQ